MCAGSRGEAEWVGVGLHQVHSGEGVCLRLFEKLTMFTRSAVVVIL